MAEKLADKFDISVRTVYRDIRALEEIGIPVSFENNKGYFVVQGYFLPPVSFTSDEANALIVLAALANRFGDKFIVKSSDNALNKIRAVLRQGDKEKTEKLVSKIKVFNPYNGLNNHLSEIQNAISEQQVLEIEYTDAKQNITKREIEPIGMIYYTEQWHVIAWCWMRNDYRDFRMFQIGSLRNTAKPFRKTDHITIEEHIRDWK